MRPIVLDEWIERDLGKLAIAGELPPAFEVDEAVLQVEDVLRSSGRRSPALVGPPGVGKTAIVQELVRRAHAGTGAALLRDARVVQISLRAISSRFKERAEAINFFQDLVTALTSSRTPIVPFVRDLHLAYAFDWEPALIRLLHDLPHPILAEAPQRDLELLIENWSDLAEAILPIPVEEPRPDRLERMVRAWCDHTSGRPIGADAQRTAIELTARFMGDRPFPRKVLDLLRQTLDLAGPERAGEDVGVREVVRRFSQLTRVPTRLVDPDEALDLPEVWRFVSSRLLGQDEAVDAVVRMISLIKAGLADIRRPFATFMFVGPTGVGKTHCAQLLAEYLFGDRNRVFRVNMADYADPSDSNLLFGNPYAHQIKDQRGLLSTLLQGRPFGVLLLDEFEKASQKVHDAFLQLVDEGRFINGRAETVSVTSLIVIATSNAGAEVYRSAGLGFDVGRSEHELDAETDRRLLQRFRFEFLNRFDRIVHFHPLSRENIRQIAERELAELARRDGLVGRKLTLEVDLDVLDWLVAHGYHPHYGARFLRREIERHVSATLAAFIVSERPTAGTRIALGVRRDRITARTVSAPDPRTPVALPGGRAKKLPRDALIAEARAWVARWEPLLAESAARRAEASALIEQSARPGFWSQGEPAQQILARYAVLDARLQAEKRLTQPAARLRQLLEQEDDAKADRIASALEESAAAWRRWSELGAEQGPGAAWLLIEPADPLSHASRWVADLAAMYLAWARRNGVEATVAAEEAASGQVVRVVLSIEGAGVQGLLEMEHGEHRRRLPGENVERALVEVIPVRPDEPAWPHAEVRDARHGTGILLDRRTAQVSLEVPSRGLKWVLHGPSADVLRAVARDLGVALSGPPIVELARTYGIHGGGTWDPRTNVAVAGVREVLKGALEPFRRGWEVRQRT